MSGRVLFTHDCRGKRWCPGCGDRTILDESKDLCPDCDQGFGPVRGVFIERPSGGPKAPVLVRVVAWAYRRWGR